MILSTVYEVSTEAYYSEGVAAKENNSMAAKNDRVESALLRRINERRLLEVIQRSGPSSRAALTRLSGLTAPTVSKAVESLLTRGLIEELDPIEPALGRPGRLVRMATDSATVLGAVIDTDLCCVTAAGLDGRISEEQTLRFPTPNTYAALLDALEEHCKTLLTRTSAAPRGIGLSVPGLVNQRLKQVVFCPNLHLLDKQNPARDLEARLGVECLLLHETDALCLSERTYGDARGMQDFALLDVTRGLGLGVVEGGELVAGHSGMAGEIGHITVDPAGVRCGCGNRGCLETLATDAALVRLMADRASTSLTLADAARLLDERPADFQHEVRTVTEHMAIAIAAVINIFNPTTVFVHGTLLVDHKERFDQVLERVKQRTLTASLAECAIVPTKSSKRQGAVAGIMHRLTNAWAPAIR